MSDFLTSYSPDHSPRFTPATGARPHDPLQPDDMTAVTGFPVEGVIRENESRDDPPNAAMDAGSWHLHFELGGGRFVTFYANRFPSGEMTVEEDLECWTHEQRFEPIEGVGDQAVVLEDETIGVGIGQEWSLQIQSSDDLARSARVALASTAAARMASAGTGATGRARDRLQP